MNNINIKTPAELSLMRESGRLLARVFEALNSLVVAGITTLEINQFVEHFIVEVLAARPASKGQYGYQYVLNSSINEVVCHGVPSATKRLRNGDIVNLDITLEKNGFIADSSKMYVIGETSLQARRLVDVAYQAMWEGINQVRPGATTGDIGHAIQTYTERHGFTVVRDYCGHGIGREMHEEPQILHFGRAKTGVTLTEGMVFTIEPMINQGSYKTKQKKDGWTVITRDRKLSAQWEHTLAVTATGYEVLTLRPEEAMA
ncbi:type I methionyl aminopeptidase [Alteromonas gilva]|uniref:Methionine aminopeptidase n=1 Tax=Alteromonas gilva TaxID=2987522 RepID=A0ABT5L8S8_9ALTE|nr:type I methionyl aminopeptidase [Alteromonas gilva]MDC8832372.1 type I methionyl aminopeptidase [Alteromonas gilva]